MDADLEKKLKVLVDKEEIRDVLLRYARGTDRCDRDAIADCYHPDAIDDHGSWSASASNVADLIVSAIRQTANAVTHFVGNTLIEVEGDVAFVESYFQATHDYEREGRRYLRCRAGRYIDRFERRKGRWKIAERVVTDDWNRVDELKEMQAGVEQFRRGTKDKADAVYVIRRGALARSPEKMMQKG